MRGKFDTKRKADLIERFQLDPTKKCKTYSKGNRQKVAIISAFVSDVDLLILDEPTGGLDPLMQNKFFEVLGQENKKGTTIFLSSHILSEVQKICDKVAIIKEGKILKVEQIEKLRANKFKKFMIEFRNVDDRDKIAMPGIVNIEKKNSHIEFLYGGKINDILNNLAGMNVENMLIEEPSLEEIFIHYYEKDYEKGEK